MTTFPKESGEALANLQRLCQYVDFQVLPNLMARAVGCPIEVMIYPEWVLECGQKVVEAQFPQFLQMAAESGKTEEYRIGFCDGQMDGCQRVLGALFAPLIPPDAPAITQEQEERLLEMLYRGYATELTLPEDGGVVPAEMQAELAAYRADLNLPKSVEYSRGFADAQAMTAGENHATETTRIYIGMLMFWRVIEVMEKMEQLENLLVKMVGRNAVGSDPKRLRQMCRRIRKRFRPPGRPKKLPHSSDSTK